MIEILVPLDPYIPNLFLLDENGAISIQFVIF